MKTFCFECKHDCHCGRKCDQCSCYICNNIVIKTYEDYIGRNMIKNKFKSKIMTIIIMTKAKIKAVWEKIVGKRCKCDD